MNVLQKQGAIDDAATRLSDDLSGELKKIKITPEDIGDDIEILEVITDQMERRKKIIGGASADERKFQTLLEGFVDKMTDPRKGEINADDWRRLRIDYDKATPSSTRNALPDTDAYARKELWLDNRRVLNEIMHTIADKKAPNINTRARLKKMSNLIRASDNMLEKTSTLNAIEKSGLSATAKKVIGGTAAAGTLGAAGIALN